MWLALQQVWILNSKFVSVVILDYIYLVRSL